METCHVDINRVMAALDLSSYSETTFTHAVTIARKLGAELVICNVINSRQLEVLDKLGGSSYGLNSKTYTEQIMAQRQEVFEKEYLPRAQDLNPKVVYRAGLPYEQILKAIKAERADIIFMGAKGRSNLAGVLFGSTAEKVFRHAGCPVVSVRGPEHCRLPE
jgi:nucleotide-binding universal stress UspA family protein